MAEHYVEGKVKSISLLKSNVKIDSLTGKLVIDKNKIECTKVDSNFTISTKILLTIDYKQNILVENKPIKGIVYNDKNEPTTIEMDKEFKLSILLAPFIYNNTDRLLRFTYNSKTDEIIKIEIL